MQKILVTGAAGFIGFHLSRLLTLKGFEVVGIDTLNGYYDTKLKLDRLEILRTNSNFSFRTVSICDKDELDDLFKANKFDIVINLAAQAGVRYSVDKPYKYIDSNLIGFINVLEACRNNPVEHLIFASSSSVYGNVDIPFSETQITDQPLSLYAATKKSNELMAHSYAYLYNIPTTGLRFFTVYGPYGRPDMAYFSFTRRIMENEPIKVYNNGDLMRDFTYVDDIVEAISRLIDHKHFNQEIPFRIFNIGNNSPVKLLDFISVLENAIGKKAVKEFLPMQDGDVYTTYADITNLQQAIGFKPSTPIEEGIGKFVRWYREYYQV
jgi:UDP-glucuronate 4-epimerase